MNKNSLSLRNFEIDYLEEHLEGLGVSVEELLTDELSEDYIWILKGRGIELLESCQGDIYEPSERWSILKVGDEYWKVEFKYYSFSGYEWEDSVVYRVTPKEKLIVVWEAE